MTLSSGSLVDLYRLSSQTNFKDLVDVAESMKFRYSPLNINDVHQTFSQARIDKVAESLVPIRCIHKNAKPILTKGDGNCLFNAASLALSVYVARKG